MRQKRELDRLRDAWLQEGESVVPLLEALLEDRRFDEAAATARFALSRAACRDREEVERLLVACASPPSGWAEAVERFARDPDDERWEELLTFVPPENFAQLLRMTITQLAKLGVDGDTLVAYGGRYGVVPELIALAEDGGASPEAFVRRAEETRAARGTWLGLAAQAALARGNAFACVGLLKRAVAESILPGEVEPFLLDIRERATPELARMLDAAGLQ
jgi:hypothetical protein